MTTKNTCKPEIRANYKGLSDVVVWVFNLICKLHVQEIYDRPVKMDGMMDVPQYVLVFVTD